MEAQSLFWIQTITGFVMLIGFCVWKAFIYDKKVSKK